MAERKYDVVKEVYELLDMNSAPRVSPHKSHWIEMRTKIKELKKSEMQRCLDKISEFQGRPDPYGDREVNKEVVRKLEEVKEEIRNG